MTALEPTVTAAGGTVLIPVVERHADWSRPLGAVAVRGDGTVCFVPVVDPQRLAWCAVAGLAAAAAVVAAGTAARRSGASVGAVSMGPGGWLSVKGAAPAHLLPRRRTPRPWWARLIRAHRLVVE
ncbi:hypothetical protein AB0H83_27065 [Dactylosporangium sp. NPDC050688]|uniref:hypothetical protein n=1 Tax=Dactylosporangium sp. NPDC050688 TaxID=3157217 RepID=UPI0033D1000B